MVEKNLNATQVDDIKTCAPTEHACGALQRRMHNQPFYYDDGSERIAILPDIIVTEMESHAYRYIFNITNEQSHTIT